MQYKVSSNETLRDYLVNIGERTCSCRKWQGTGIPCSHALGVIIGGLKDNPQVYTKPFYTLDAFNKTYASPIMHPNSKIDYTRPLDLQPPEGMDVGLSDIEVLSESSSSDSDDILLAPNTRRGVGRHPNKRKRPTATALEKQRIQKCGRCKAVGHSKRTCGEAI